MLCLTIDLHPHGNGDLAETLVAIAIWNTGETQSTEIGNYGFAISHQQGTPYANKAAAATQIAFPKPRDLLNDANKAWVWKRGKITGFRRPKGAAALVAAVLRKAFP